MTKRFAIVGMISHTYFWKGGEMEPLITIETVPIKIEFVEKKPLKMSAVHETQISVAQEQGTQSIKAQPLIIPVQDTFESSSTYNWDHSTYTATAKVGDDGNLKLNIQMEDGEARSIRFEQTNRGIDSIAALLPSTTQDENYAASSMEISFSMNDLPSAMPAVDNMSAEFYPPDLELVVTQRPKVIITYVGGPIYVPRSSDPDYKPIIGFEDVAVIGDGSIMDHKV